MIPKILVKRTHIEVNNYREGDSSNLERFFSVWDKAYYKFFPKARKIDKGKKILYLPRGMNIGRLESYFDVNATIDKKVDPFDRGIDIKLAFMPRDEVQKEAIRFVLGMQEYEYTKHKSQLSINLTTGKGKTYISIVSAAVLKVRTIMITSSIGWIDQWKDRIMEYTDTRSNEIYVIAGISSIARIVNGKENIDKYKYILASHMTIKSYGDKYGWHKVGELFAKLRVGLKIYDEAHIDFDNICSIDFATNTYKTLYLTATPARSDPSENRIYQEAFRNVPAINLFDDDNDPRTRYIAISYSSHPSPEEISRCMNAYGFNRIGYCSYITERPEFYKLLRALMTIIFRKGKTLIYIGTNEAIMKVYNWMRVCYPEIADQIGIYTTLITNKEEKEQQLDKMIILSTTKSCGAAMDIKGLKLTIVLAEPFKSKVIAIQTIGRTRDVGTDYIDIVDTGFSHLNMYYHEKLKVFQKYATETAIVRLNDKQLNEAALKEINLQYARCQELMSLRPKRKLIECVKYEPKK